MLKVPFDYYGPASLQEAVDLMDRFRGKAKILAGGTDLLLALQKEEADCETLVDIRKVKELGEVTKAGNDLVVGAFVSFAKLIRHPLVQEYALLLALASSEVGSPQIRNRGTIGGNLGTASPAGDLLTPLVALEARIVVIGPEGRREISVGKFLGGEAHERLQNNEIICEVKIPLGASQDTRSAFVKLGRRKALAISRLSVALFLEMENCLVARARLSVGAAGLIPFRVFRAEQYLVQKNCCFEAGEVMELVSRAVADSLGERPSAPYKVVAVKGLVLEALSKCELV